jgi:hypothetical protein
MKLLRDPLIHFVAIGAALFGLVTFTGGESGPSPGEIVVTTGRIASLQAIFAETWQRPPTQAETESLVEEYVRDEVLYREAVAMGLDQDDAVIRRRLRQKFEFVVDNASQTEPTDSELQAYIAEHPDWFRDEPRLSFTHVYFSADNPLVGDKAALERLRQELERGTASPAEMGDAFLAGVDFQSLPRSEVAELFGEEFALALAKADAGEWAGPIASAYGMHLAKVIARQDAAALPADRALQIARRELMNERRLEAAEALYKELRGRYLVTVEPTPSDARLAQAVQ